MNFQLSEEYMLIRSTVFQTDVDQSVYDKEWAMLLVEWISERIYHLQVKQRFSPKSAIMVDCPLNDIK